MRIYLIPSVLALGKVKIIKRLNLFHMCVLLFESFNLQIRYSNEFGIQIGSIIKINYNHTKSYCEH